MAGELFLRRCYSTQGAGGSHDSHPELGLLLFVAVSVISSPSPLSSSSK